MMLVCFGFVNSVEYDLFFNFGLVGYIECDAVYMFFLSLFLLMVCLFFLCIWFDECSVDILFLKVKFV